MLDVTVRVQVTPYFHVQFDCSMFVVQVCSSLRLLQESGGHFKGANGVHINTLS